MERKEANSLLRQTQIKKSVTDDITDSINESVRES